ncbi:hypothetical protein P43SY_002708 [Pythium insidiosum]|uniref:Transmembrane protein n=1 Tax=Pythium insidiosum TaxID=114742 RepID=A0AAD5MAD2_PYTIN|nr:hypothetical protein P43SY_002708 [Pythium insidiosum]
MRFHAAEIFADMAAEYIAIGSSITFIFFYREHPHYLLSNRRSGAAASSATTSWTPSALWGLQLALELVIDLLSSTAEILAGTSFGDIRRQAPFIIVTFVAIAILNVQISTVFYLQDAPSAAIISS